MIHSALINRPRPEGSLTFKQRPDLKAWLRADAVYNHTVRRSGRPTLGNQRPELLKKRPVLQRHDQLRHSRIVQ